MEPDWDYIAWLWREIPRSWKTSAAICFIECCYLLLQIWSVIQG